LYDVKKTDNLFRSQYNLQKLSDILFHQGRCVARIEQFSLFTGLNCYPGASHKVGYTPWGPGLSRCDNLWQGRVRIMWRHTVFYHTYKTRNLNDVYNFMLW